MSIYQPAIQAQNDSNFNLTLPQINLMGLSRRAERRVLKAQDEQQAEAMIQCVKIAKDLTIGTAAVLSQAQLDQIITNFQARNPNPTAQRNLEFLSRAHAVKMLRYICDDDDPLF